MCHEHYLSLSVGAVQKVHKVLCQLKIGITRNVLSLKAKCLKIDCKQTQSCDVAKVQEARCDSWKFVIVTINEDVTTSNYIVNGT